MKFKGLFLISIFLFLFSISQSFGYETYYNIGGNDYQSNNPDVSFWNENLISDTFSTRNLGTPRGSPLVADLDGDGTNEIIVLDDDTIILFQSKDLTSLTSATLESQIAGMYYSNMIAFDIDNDYYIEVIVAQEHNQNLTIWEYNGTDFYLENSFDISGSGHVSIAGADAFRSGTCILGCGEIEKCLLLCSSYNRGAGFNNGLYASYFNSTHLNDETTIRGGVVGSDIYFPKVPIITYNDFDNDGLSEFIFSYYYEAGTDYLYITTLNINSSFHPVLDKEVGYEPVFNLGINWGDTRQGGYPYLSSPLVIDFKTSTATKEILIANQNTANDFVLKAFTSNLALLSTYPVLTNTDGELISNPFLVSANDDTGLNDVCVAGFDDDERVIDVLCASAESGALLSNYEYIYEMDDDLFNITTDNNLAITLSHGIESKQLNDVSEILLPYGVFELDINSCNFITGECDLNLLYPNPSGTQGVFIPVDVEKSGKPDLLLLTESNLFYYDDGFTNQNAYIDGSLTVKPCAITQPIKTNETMRITFKVSDPESDPVNATVYIYYDEADEESQSQIGISGSTFTFDFIMRNVTSSSLLQIEIRDTIESHILTPVIYNYSFSVSNNGIEFDSDCIDSFVFTVPEDDEDLESGDLSDADKSSIIEGVLPTEIFPPVYYPLIAIFIIIVLVFGSLSVLLQYGVRDSSVLVAIPLSVGLLTWLILVFMNMISGWTVIVGILISGAVLGFKFFQNSSGG